jgi:3-methyladenine DNA glycosylase AlkC
VVQHLLARRGAARIALIPLEALNEGLVPTAKLNEFLALDLARLARRVARDIGLDPRAERLDDTLAMLPAFKPIRRHHHVARTLYGLTLPRDDRDAVAHRLATHPSDVARCWAAQWVTFSGLSLDAQLHAVRRFAADPHFGVREMAWSAVREEVAVDVDAAVALLAGWVRDGDPHIRRCASELTRPHGVWCAPLQALKAEPWRGLPLLEPLKSDPSLYVRNSVANWLNDASRTSPQWVVATCARWARESDTAETAFITRRAQRTLNRTPTAGRAVRTEV